MAELKTNVLCFGDNLEILRNKDYFPDKCIDKPFCHTYNYAYPA